MAKNTEKLIKDTFSALLEERPLTEITVKEIVDNCGLNRNSFYYHYEDIPSLLDDLVKEYAIEIIKEYPTVSSIVDAFDAIREFSSMHKRKIMHIYRSVSREGFEKGLTEVSDYFVRKYVESAIGELDIGTSLSVEDKETVIAYYRSVCFGCIIGWLESGMDEEFADKIRRIFVLKKDFAKEFAGLLEGQV